MSKIMNNLEPANSVINALGGCRPLARQIKSISEGTHKITPSGISRWARSVEGRGTGGKIPVKHWPVLLQVSKQLGVKGKVAVLLKRHTDIALGKS